MAVAAEGAAMSGDREQILRGMYVDGPTKHAAMKYLFELLDAERALRVQAQQERDGALGQISVMRAQVWYERSLRDEARELSRRLLARLETDPSVAANQVAAVVEGIVQTESAAEARVAELEQALRENDRLGAMLYRALDGIYIEELNGRLCALPETLPDFGDDEPPNRELGCCASCRAHWNRTREALAAWEARAAGVAETKEPT